jgi:uncharacterized membrane protein YheB (UPF0754 family)
MPLTQVLQVVPYALLPLVSALIGWLTNHIAVRMIFRPRKPIRMLGLEIVGLIPKRRADLARKIGDTVEKELISHRDIEEVVRSPRFQKDIAAILRRRIDDFIGKNLGNGPFVSLLLSGETARGIREVLVNEILRMLPGSMDMFFEKIESRVKFSEIVRKRIESFELSRLEGIVYTIAARELRAIEVFGAVLGFVIGLIQLGILAAGAFI